MAVVCKTMRMLPIGKEFVHYVVNPLLMVSLIMLGTVWLFEERSVRLAAVDHSASRTVGFGERQILPLGEWQDLYGGGFGYDRVIALQDPSLRVSTGADGGWYGAVAHMPPYDMSEGSISVAFRAADWSEIDRAMLIFSADEAMQHYYGLNLTNYFANPANGEWIEVVLPLQAFSVIEGQPDWNTITTVAMRVIPVAGVATRVWFDELVFVPGTAEEGVVSLTFDDGFATTMQAQEVMHQYGYRGTAFIIPDWLGRDGHLEQNDVDILAAAGWDISGHGPMNLVDMIPADVDTHLAYVYEFLAANDYQGRHHYAYPNGGYTDSVRSQVLEYFVSGRTIDGFLQPPEQIYPATVNAVTVSSEMSVEEVIAYIYAAKKERQWLNLVWHDFTLQPERDIEYRLADFAMIMAYLAEQEIVVLPYSEAYDRFVYGQ